MIKIIKVSKRDYKSQFNKLLLKKKNQLNLKSNLDIVKKIIKDVKNNGDKAIIKYEKKFSKNTQIVSSQKNNNKIIKSLNPKVKKAIDFAFKRIRRFHLKQKIKNIYYKDSLNNKLDYKYISLNSVGIYVPGGNASFPSTVLMNAVPARIAGVKRIVMVNPKLNGSLSPGVLYAAKKVGIKEIYCIGGVQAIAGLAYGTKKIQKVDKIFGPGKYICFNS